MENLSQAKRRYKEDIKHVMDTYEYLDLGFDVSVSLLKEDYEQHFGEVQDEFSFDEFIVWVKGEEARLEVVQ